MNIGVFGGTFSPPHMGHIRSAEIFINEMKLDRLIVIPAFCSPGKNGENEIQPMHRFNMCALAFNCEKITLSDIEIKREGKSYTADTLRILKKQYPDDRLFFLIGSDKIFGLDRWRCADEMFGLCDFVCIGRADEKEKILGKIAFLRKQFDAKIRLISVRTGAEELSSEKARELIKNGENADMLVPLPVLSYIKENKLYK